MHGTARSRKSRAKARRMELLDDTPLTLPLVAYGGQQQEGGVDYDRPLPPSDTWASLIADWSAATLRVPFGRLKGEPFVLPSWQVAFLHQAFDKATTDAALCISRKNGKTGLVAVVLLAFLYGPLARTEWRGAAVSLNANTAKELRDAITSTAKASGIAVDLRLAPPPGRVLGLPDGNRVEFYSSDRATGHGIGADLVIVDEAGLMRENERLLWDALRSCISGRDNSRMLSMSIRGDCPMFEELRARGERGERGIVWVEYAAPEDCELDDRDAWVAANPGLGTIKSVQYMEARYQAAVASPASEPSFRALDLNQQIDPSVELPITLHQLRGIEVAALPPAEGPCFLGLDLGGSKSMTCMAAYWPLTGRSEVWGAFPSIPDLEVRGAADAVATLYLRMREAGHLRTYPGRVQPVLPFMRDSFIRLSSYDVKGVWCDRYRREEMADAMDTLHRMEAMKDRPRLPVIYRGQGAEEGSSDLRYLQEAVNAKRVRIQRNHLLLMGACRQAVVKMEKIEYAVVVKRHSLARIDALQAWMLAVSAGERNMPKRRDTSSFILATI